MQELLDIVDEYGNPTGQTVDREKAHAEGIMHRTSHVWILRKKAGKLFHDRQYSRIFALWTDREETDA